ncbi:MAG: UvrD-helicase domain-containing protein [Acidimicrobiia bacterium]|nr:UvrD-helicase domain-containing protein [Acidimicrobiia bacterium]
MNLPGPSVLGRGVVVRPDAPIPEPWSDAPVVTIDEATLDSAARLEALVERLHRSWVAREALVVSWNVADEALAVDERFVEPPWQVHAGFLFPFERLRFLVFSNNYDARNGTIRWWWSHKAARTVGATPGPGPDATLPDGTPVWIDGGPRQPLPELDAPVLSGESIDVGRTTPIPSVAAPPADGLADDQLDAVAHLVGPSRVIAPAGSGKTRTLAARLRHLVAERGVEPSLVTAVAYNARAANELRVRLDADRSMVRTIHSLGWAIVREVHPGVELIEEGEVRNVLGRLVSVPKRANTDPLGPYLEALEQVRAGLRDPEDVEAERDDIPGFASVFEDYRERLYRRGRVDHGEQVYGAIEALLRDPALRARWQQQYRHLLVDEFQDLTPAYLLLLRLIAAPQLQVFGVGDDDQVIYGYAGADPGFLIDFDRYFPGAGEHALETNYRCPPAIVDAATHLLAYNDRRIAKTIHAAKSSNGDGALTVDRRDGADLAAIAADRIVQWTDDGVAPNEIAVLTRVNSSLIPVKAALVERGFGTTDLLDARSLQRTTLRALFAWLRIGMRPERFSRQDALEAIRRPARGLTTVARDLLTRSRFDLDDLVALGARLDGKQAQRWDQLADDLVAVAESAARNDAAATLGLLIDDLGLASSARNLDDARTNASRSSHLDDLVAVRRAAALHEDLEDFLPWLQSAIDTPSVSDGVVLSSVHRVKGMEWPRVIVFGADRGTMPHELADDIEEERRVFHVAITRAIEEVVILADRDRSSRFLAELDGSAPKRKEPARRPRQERLPRRKQKAAAVYVGDEVRISGGYDGSVVAVNDDRVSVRLETGADLIVPASDILAVTSSTAPTPADAPDPTLVEALRMWRRETSDRLAVPAYVVMHDATMDAIAAAKPTTERQLINVPGIGPAKLDQYGDEILALVEANAGKE